MGQGNVVSHVVASPGTTFRNLARALRSRKLGAVITESGSALVELRNLLESLPVSPDSYQVLLQDIPAAAYVCDAGGLIEACNDRAVELWGREPLLKDPRDRFCGSFHMYDAQGQPIDHSQSAMARALEENRAFNGQEVIIERCDGSRRTVLAHANPFQDADGRAVAAINVLVDISDQYVFIDASQQLSAIVDSANDAIIGKTLDGTIVTWNAAASELYGLSADEAIGQSIKIIVPPERHGEVDGFLDRLRRGEKIDHFETQRVRSDGSLVDISLSISPICDSQGHVYGASAIARNMTDQNRIRRRLEIRERQQRTAAELGAAGLLNRNLSDFLNQCVERTAEALGVEYCKILELDPEDSTLLLRAGVGWKEGLVGTVRISSEEDSQAGYTLQSNEPVIVRDLSTETRFRGPELLHDHEVVSGLSTIIRRSQGTYGILGAHTKQQREFSQDDVHFLQVVANIIINVIDRAEVENVQLELERIRRQSAEQQLTEMKGELVRSTRLAMLGRISAQVAHDLRNPLGSIRNAAWFIETELSGRQGEGNDRAIEFTQLIQDEIETCDTIIRNLLEAARPRRPLCRPLNLIDVVRAAVSRLEIPAAVELRVEVPDDEVRVSFDPVQARQVMDNLLSNACDAVGRKGFIEIQLSVDERQAMMWIRDSGPGVPPEVRTSAFDLLVTTKPKGTGLGLAICRQILENHGGTIELEDTGAEGASFRVVVPLLMQTGGGINVSQEQKPCP